MPFKEYDDFAAGPLRFPIRGKVYEVPEVPYDAGVKLQAVEGGDSDLPADEQWRLLMGSAYDEMRADGVPASALARAIMACLVDYRTGDRDLAEKAWEAGVGPEALAPKGATDPTSTGTDEATTTPNPASTTGTTSPKGSAKKAPKAAPSPTSASTSA